MKRYLETGIIGLMLLVVISACHTYIFQPVKKQLVGKWLLSDSDTSKKETWEFKSDGTLEIKINDTALFYVSPTSGDTLPYIEWKVENKITKHYLYTDAWWAGPGRTIPEEEMGRWLVVKVNKKKLYLSSEHKKKIRGSYQKGFTKM